MRISNKKQLYVLALVFLVALIVGVSGIYNNIAFSAEFGDNLLEVKNAISSQKIPLLGPPTSHPWLYFGPLYYWILIPVLSLVGYSPIYAVWIGLLTGLIIVVLNYFVVGDIFDKRTAYFSSFLIAISPLFVQFSRDARFYFIVALLFYPFIWLLYKIWNGEFKHSFLLGLVYGLFFHFHYSPLVLLPGIIIVFYLRRKKLLLKNYLDTFIGFGLSFVPFLLSDLENNFQMTKGFLVWIPYRILGFLGFIPKNNPTTETVFEYLRSTKQFVGGLFVLDKTSVFVVSAVFVILLMFFIYENRKNIFSDFGVFIIVVFLLSAFVATFIHGDVPFHYYLPVFSLPILLVSVLISKYSNNKLVLGLVICTLTAMFFQNYKVAKDSNKFYKKDIVPTISPHFVPYKYLKEISNRIVIDADGEKFKLSRVGPFDEFEENYSQNYRYLMWIYGNEPVEESTLEYIIFEDLSKLPDGEYEKLDFKDIIVVKKKL